MKYRIDILPPNEEAIVEPVTLAQLKQHLNFPTTYNVDDDLLSRYITVVRTLFEHETGRAVVTQRFKQHMDGWLYAMPLMMGGVTDILAVTYLDEEHEEQQFEDFLTDLGGTPAWVLVEDSVTFPETSDLYPMPVMIEFTAGMAAYPADLQVAILEGCALKYRFRESEADIALKEISLSWCNIVAKYLTGLETF